MNEAIGACVRAQLLRVFWMNRVLMMQNVVGRCKSADDALLMPILLYGSQTNVWRENEKYRIRTVQMNTLRGLLGIRRIDSA